MRISKVKIEMVTIELSGLDFAHLAYMLAVLQPEYLTKEVKETHSRLVEIMKGMAVNG